MAKLKLVSDGTVAGTSVVDAATGDAIPNVKALTLKIVNGEWVAELELTKAELEIAVDSSVKVKA